MEIAANMTLARPEKFVNGWSHQQALTALADAGFSHLDFSFAFEAKADMAYGATPFYSDGWRDFCRGMRELAAQRGADFTQTHSLMFNYFDPACAHLLPMAQRVIEATALLGAHVVVMHPIAPPGMEGNIPACLKANRDYFRAQAELAQENGVSLAIENMITTRRTDGTQIWRYCHSAEQLLELVDAVDRPNVGVCVDVGHAHYMSLPLEETIKSVGSRLIALHIHDNNRLDDQHLCPYVGTLDWEQVYAGLRAIRYEGVFTLEVLHLCERMPAHLRVPFLQKIRELTAWMADQAEDKGGKTA